MPMLILFRPVTKILLVLSILVLTMGFSHAAISDPLSDGDAAISRASDLQQVGQFELAVREWRSARLHFQAAGNREREIEAMLGEAEAMRATGRYSQAMKVLNDADQVAGQAGLEGMQAHIAASLSGLYLQTGNRGEAERMLTVAQAYSGSMKDKSRQATLANHRGNLMVALERYPEALAAYAQAADLASEATEPVLQGQILVNAARAAQLAGDITQADTLTRKAFSLANAWPDSRDKAWVLVSLGQLWSGTLTPADPALAGQILTSARLTAQKTGDASALSYALGYQARLYAGKGRTREAMELDTQAIAATGSLAVPEIVYRWYWHRGKLRGAQGEMDGAIADYRQAVTAMQSIRGDLPVASAAGKSSFRDVLAPMYFELANLLLKQASASSGEVRQRYLREARATVEQTKAAELQDYFQDKCVAAQQDRLGQASSRLDKGVAVIYPIMLEDRLELLADFDDGTIEQFTLAVPSASMVEKANQLRARLEKRTTREYLPLAQEMHAWLIGPMERALEKHEVKTLVFVPDGVLRTIPMAALHDGERFLIAKYAIATTPSLGLTDLRPSATARGGRVLLSGLTESVQGFPGLPNVAEELQEIGLMYKGKTLKDQDYLLGNVDDEMSQSPYNVVHIASHGQFESDVRKTFLLAYDGRLTLDHLEKLIAPSRYREQQLSLLTLSACQTAAGDDRAALGLAGVAVKAGAVSALASLWFVNDQSATLLVSGFYQQLNQPGAGKAFALQQAQLKMTADKRFGHPGYWSPFLLIGNWR
ncbi:MAG: CHAT domain-containing protein [Sulfuricellaceae bacterium]|nr:CHAT domain-containing protein [Sulfuricellaceae bacterium]